MKTTRIKNVSKEKRSSGLRSMKPLLLPYIFNILVVIPVGLTMHARRSRAGSWYSRANYWRVPRCERSRALPGR